MFRCLKIYQYRQYENVFPCTFFNISCGNIREKSLKDIWNTSHFLKIIRSINKNHFDKCKNCNIKEECYTCLASNINENSDVFKISDEFCTSRKGLLD